MTTETCTQCGAVRPLTDLLIVVALDDPTRVRYVCKPSIGPMLRGKTCFGWEARAAALDRIGEAA